jgi:2-methylcitrate dehydratase PrpD
MSITTDLTARVSDTVAGLRFADLPSVAVARATAAIADTVGCALAGVTSPAVAPVLDVVLDEGGHAQASIFGRPERVPASSAALVNGTAAHSLDFDDISSEMYGHPSVALVPALFAVAEKIGSPGRDIVAAYVAGYEVGAVVGRRVNPGHYDRGWHATATLGTLAAAGAVGRLLGLSSEQMRHALGIAASQAAGMRRQFGTDVKPLHAGLAARAGVLSAHLASRGMRADPAILDGSASDGFAALYGGPSLDTIAEAAVLHHELAIVTRGLQVKRHACCAATHTSIDAVLQLVAAHGLRADAIEAIECRINRIAAEVLRYHRPATALEAKFSLEFCVATAVLEGHCGISQFTQARVEDSALRAVASRVHAQVDPSMSPLGTTPCRMTLRTRNGRTLTADVPAPRGSPDFPLTRDELRQKFVACAGMRLQEADAACLFERLLDLPAVSHLDEAMGLTRRA